MSASMKRLLWYGGVAVVVTTLVVFTVQRYAGEHIFTDKLVLAQTRTSNCTCSEKADNAPTGYRLVNSSASESPLFLAHAAKSNGAYSWLMESSKNTTDPALKTHKSPLGGRFLFMRNVCVQLYKGRRKSKFLFYRPGKDNTTVPLHVQESLSTDKGSGFFYGRGLFSDRFEEVYNNTPADAHWHDQLALLIWPPYLNHIPHFMDGMMGAYHEVDRFSELEWIRNVRAVHWVQDQGRPFPVTDHLFDFLTDFVRTKVSKIVESKAYEQLSGDGDLHCYKYAVLSGFFQPALGTCSHFYSIESANTFRTRLLDFMKVPEPPLPSLQRFRVFVLNRRGPRGINNFDDVIYKMKTIGSLDFDWANELVLNHFPEKGSFVEQLSVARTADILIGVHGGGLYLSEFMKEGSVVIEIVPPWVMDLNYYIESTSAGMKHVLLLSHTLSPSCPKPNTCNATTLRFNQTKECDSAGKSDCSITLNAEDIDDLSIQLTAAKLWLTYRQEMQELKGI